MKMKLSPRKSIFSIFRFLFVISEAWMEFLFPLDDYMCLCLHVPLLACAFACICLCLHQPLLAPAFACPHFGWPIMLVMLYLLGLMLDDWQCLSCCIWYCLVWYWLIGNACHVVSDIARFDIGWSACLYIASDIACFYISRLIFPIPIYSQWTKHNRYIYHTISFDPTYWR